MPMPLVACKFFMPTGTPASCSGFFWRSLALGRCASLQASWGVRVQKEHRIGSSQSMQVGHCVHDLHRRELPGVDALRKLYGLQAAYLLMFYLRKVPFSCSQDEESLLNRLMLQSSQRLTTGRVTREGWSASCNTVWVATRACAAPSAPKGPPVLRFLSHWGKSLLETCTRIRCPALKT